MHSLTVGPPWTVLLLPLHCHKIANITLSRSCWGCSCTEVSVNLGNKWQIRKINFSISTTKKRSWLTELTAFQKNNQAHPLPSPPSLHSPCSWETPDAMAPSPQGQQHPEFPSTGLWQRPPAHPIRNYWALTVLTAVPMITSVSSTTVWVWSGREALLILFTKINNSRIHRFFPSAVCYFSLLRCSPKSNSSSSVITRG